MGFKPYHLLVEKNDGKWSIQFGDFSKQTVVQEMRDVKDGWRPDNTAPLKVITADSVSPEDCAAAIARLEADEAQRVEEAEKTERRGAHHG